MFSEKEKQQEEEENICVFCMFAKKFPLLFIEFHVFKGLDR